jgi:DNA (cytosine-5)-methyltransferase 1
MTKLRVLDLFSGVGAYSLGLERTGGFQTVAFCELEDYPRRILRKHWPDVKIYEDVRELTGARLAADGIVPDWIVAGWPCQDISSAGTGHGLDGARSGLWAEIARLAGELRPRGLLLENSSNLLSINGGADFGRVLGDLASLGFDAEWHCLPAAAFDAPHIRDRLWIVATSADANLRCKHDVPINAEMAASPQSVADASRVQRGWEEQRAKRERVGPGGEPETVSNAKVVGRRKRKQDGTRSGSRTRAREEYRPGNGGGTLADTDSVGGRTRHQGASEGQGAEFGGNGANLAHANIVAPIGTAIARIERHTWEPEPGLGRVATGIADRVDRLRAIGNLNPPIIPETIGRAILAAQDNVVPIKRGGTL